MHCLNQMNTLNSKNAIVELRLAAHIRKLLLHYTVCFWSLSETYFLNANPFCKRVILLKSLLNTLVVISKSEELNLLRIAVPAVVVPLESVQLHMWQDWLRKTAIPVPHSISLVVSPASICFRLMAVFLLFVRGSQHLCYYNVILQ